MFTSPPLDNPLDRLRSNLPQLTGKLREAGRYIIEHAFDASTRSMRDLAQAASLQPATFTRLAQAIGHEGWDSFRDRLIESQRSERQGPFSGRMSKRNFIPGSHARLVSDMMEADTGFVASLNPEAIIRAARTLVAAPRIWIAGFRSCRSVAVLFHYQVRLFRPDDLRLVGGTGPEDCDFGAFKTSDTIIVIGFEPYSRASVLTAESARAAGCRLIAIADRATAPIAESADHLITFGAAATPAFFPSLTGAMGAVQALAAVMFELGGKEYAARLQLTEARLAALSQYVPEPSI